MYKWVTNTKRFDTGDAKDRASYAEILNNPLCVIIEREKEKISNKVTSGGDDGITEIDERLLVVMTWKERTIL